VRQTGAKSLSLYHRLGITFVILGMLQSFAPTCFRVTRSSLRVKGHLRVAFAPLLDVEPATTSYLTWAGPSLSTATAQDQESDQESHDAEDLSETFAWPEAMTDHRSAQRSGAVALPSSLLRPGHAAERTRSALQRSRSLPILAASSANATARLCRFTC
jgi:hypothetical protein